MSSIIKVIAHLEESISSGEGIHIYFKYPKELLSALKEISALIGMKKLKDIVSMMVCRNVVSIYDGEATENDFMNHILLLGNPGSGKTTTANLISRVICAIGFLKPGEVSEKKPMTNHLSAEVVNQNFYVVKRASKMKEIINSVNTTMEKCNTIMDRIGNESNSLQSKIQEGSSKNGSMVVIKNVNLHEVVTSSKKLSSLVGELRQIIDKNVYITSVEEDRIEMDYMKEESISKNFNNKIIVASRDKLIGGYVGQTAIKVNSIVEEAFEGVLFVDEAYNMINFDDSGNEGFSMEAVSTLCGCMSKHNNNFVLILAGYRDETIKMLETNPGMMRRFGYVIDIEDYTPKEVAQIFKIQLKKKGLRLDPSVSLEKIVERNIEVIGKSGAMTNQLSGIIELEISLNRYNSIRKGDGSIPLIKTETIESSIKTLKANVKPFGGDKVPINHMYS